MKTNSADIAKRVAWQAGEAIAAATATLLLTASCSVGALFDEELARQDAVVVMSDGTKLSGKTRLPDWRSRPFTLSTPDGRRLRLHPDSTGMVAFSRDGRQAGVFISAAYKDFGGSLQPPAWMLCLGSGPHLRIAVVAASWHYDRRGRLVPVSFADGDAYIIGLKGGGEGKCLATYGRPAAVVGRALRSFLSDDPQLCRAIGDGEVDALDFGEICRRYEPRGNRGYDVRMALLDGCHKARKGGLP